MGDRANIRIIGMEQQQDELFFYTHSYGTELWETLQKALQRKVRWGVPSYLNRIIFSEMIKDSCDGELGYGISLVYPCDQNWPHLTVNHMDQTVSTRDKVFSFEGYCDLKEDPRGGELIIEEYGR